jgi:hypothetical protein
MGIRHFERAKRREIFKLAQLLKCLTTYMKNILFVLLATSLFCCVASAQQKVIFKEDFEGYDNDWKLVDNKEFTVKQEQGNLSFSKQNKNGDNNGCLWYKRTINDFYTNKNFSIEFEANSISSESTWGCFDIQWGKIQEFDGVRKTSVYQLDFGLDKVRLAKFDLSKGWKYFKWSSELMDNSLSGFSLDRNVFNKFEITQNDGILLVKVNGKLVYKFQIEPQIGSEIGFQQCLKGEWQLDNLIIKQ